MKHSRFVLVTLPNGARTVRSLEHQETFHPVVGPSAEAQGLYLRQLNLVERLRARPEGFVIWDVGLGAAANPLTVLRATSALAGSLEIRSFDLSADSLCFAIEHGAELGYLEGYESALHELVSRGRVGFNNGTQKVIWQLQLGDFPTVLRSGEASSWPAPHAILFDPFSPARNPAMWTLSLFERLFELLNEPCSLATYSRSTLLRVTLLLAGFYVGAGHATGEKEETTIAANRLDMLGAPLEVSWLRRVRQSTSAEPLVEPVYRQARLSPESWELLREHPQFRV